VTVKAGPAGPVADVVGPLGAAARAALTRDLAQAQRDRMLREAGLRPEIELDLGRVQARLKDRAVPSAGRPPAGAARFALMAVLWMTLVGSLGMLLQAVVRERANRTLESLLASVRPSSLVAGKLLGVGAVSAVVLLAWLGGAVVLARVPGLEGLARMAGAELAPLALARAAVIYLFAYAMYGAAMVAVGVAARDLPAAQNLSRPVFAVLLLVFFGAMAAAGGGGERFAGLAWLPPLTPFLLLLFPDSLTFGAQAATLGLTALTTVALAGWASRRLIVRG
jgi:ABC-2 type transport system permease protein